jgi:hypothetical protein
MDIFSPMAAQRGAYRHKASGTTGDALRQPIRDAMRENTGLSTAEWRAMIRPLDSFLGIGKAPPVRTPKGHRPAFVRWRITYTGPSLALAMLGRLASQAVERAIAEGRATKPEGEQWRDPWEGVEE